MTVKSIYLFREKNIFLNLFFYEFCITNKTDKVIWPKTKKTLFFYQTRHEHLQVGIGIEIWKNYFLLDVPDSY